MINSNYILCKITGEPMFFWKCNNTSLISFIKSYFLLVSSKVLFLFGKVDSLAQATNKINKQIYSITTIQVLRNG